MFRPGLLPLNLLLRFPTSYLSYLIAEIAKVRSEGMYGNNRAGAFQSCRISINFPCYAFLLRARLL